MLALVVATVLIPVSAMGMASAELYSTKSYLYGRFDARIQLAPGDGVVSAYFLWKEGSDASNAYWNELDYEKVGADCHMQTNNIYGKPKSQHQQTPTLSNTCTAYHDYRFEWTPTYIAWVVDGKEIRRDTGAGATAYADNAKSGMSFHFNIWPGDSSFGGNIKNTTLPVRQYISWVEYSSYDNGNFKVEWHEDFQASGVPSGWAVGDWSSPFSLSTHSPQNVSMVNGIAVMSLTNDNATGNPGTPPVDPAAGGTGGSGGGAGGAVSTGGSGSGGSAPAGGAGGSGGQVGAGGSGGTASSGGTPSAGGNGAGGSAGSGGAPSAGGNGAGGSAGSGGSSGSGGGASQAGGAAASGGVPGAGGTSSAAGSGGATASGGTSASSGATSSGGSSSASAPNASGGSSGGSSGGCSIAHRSSALGPVLLLFFLVMSISRLRHKEF